jgi:hypothetical protein
MNGIGDEGAAAVAAVLRAPHTRALATLELMGTRIGSAGAAALGAALAENATVTKLVLCHNKLCDEGAAAIAAGLRRNTALLTLWVDQSSILADGARALVAALGDNTTLRELRPRCGAMAVEDDAEPVGGGALAPPPPIPPTAVRVPLTPAQRLMLLRGHRRASCPLSRLPPDIVRRILTRYCVAQGERRASADNRCIRTHVFGVELESSI